MPQLMSGDKLWRVENERGNTDLHESLIDGGESIALYLVKVDPMLVYYDNKLGKCGLHLAVEGGLASSVSPILECLTDSELTNDLFKRESPTEAAMMKKRLDILEVILDSSNHFIKLQDDRGRTPLHYAASLGYVEVINYLLKRHDSGAIKRDKNGAFSIVNIRFEPNSVSKANSKTRIIQVHIYNFQGLDITGVRQYLKLIHLASAEGCVDAIDLLLNNSVVDSAELLDNRGLNILHIVVKAGKFNAVRYILRGPKLDELLNIGDGSGNTPLHLVSKYLNPKISSA